MTDSQLKTIMKSLAIHFALLLTLLITSTGQGAELLLRERASEHGAIVRLGDIADISAASTMEVRSLSNTPLFPAPAAGTRQFLSLAQVRDLLVARGIQMDSLSIKGARTVEIGANIVQTVASTKTDEPQISRHEIELRVQQTILEHVQDVSTGEGEWRVEVLLNEKETLEVSALGVSLAVRGQRQLRSGRQRFYLSSMQHLSDMKRGKEVYVMATLTQVQSVVVVQQQIERGNIVRESDVKIIEREGKLPSGSLTRLEQVVGQVAQRSLRPKTILQKNHIRAAWQVRRGETVSVFVRTGGIVVRTRAVAKQDGAMGDLITVEMPENKKRLSVSVSGPGEVAIHATGGRTTDYASLDRRDRLRR